MMVRLTDDSWMEEGGQSIVIAGWLNERLDGWLNSYLDNG